MDALSYKFVCGDVIPFSLPPIAESPCECKIPVEYTCPETYRDFLVGDIGRGVLLDRGNEIRFDEHGLRLLAVKTRLLGSLWSSQCHFVRL